MHDLEEPMGRLNLAGVVDRAERGVSTIISRHGKQAAAVVPLSVLSQWKVWSTAQTSSGLEHTTFTEDARAEMLTLPGAVAEGVRAVLREMELDRATFDAATSGIQRAVVGDVRVLYTVDPENSSIIVSRVKKPGVVLDYGAESSDLSGADLTILRECVNRLSAGEDSAGPLINSVADLVTHLDVLAERRQLAQRQLRAYQELVDDARRVVAVLSQPPTTPVDRD